MARAARAVRQQVKECVLTNVNLRCAVRECVCIHVCGPPFVHYIALSLYGGADPYQTTRQRESLDCQDSSSRDGLPGKECPGMAASFKTRPISPFVWPLQSSV